MATNDLLTADEAREALGIGALDEKLSRMLGYWITSVSDLLDARVGPIVCGTITGEAHDGSSPHNGARRQIVYLDKSPVYSVTQVVEYDYTTAGTLTAESNTSKPVAGYAVDLTNGKLTRRNNNINDWFPPGQGNVVVSYVTGRFTATSTVEERYKTAAGLTLKNAWQQYEPILATAGEFELPAARFPRFAIGTAVRELLSDQWRGDSGF